MTTHKIILDTDIGTDIDDLLALTVLLNSPQANLLGITCVYGDVHIRAKIALKTLQLRGIITVPVYMGATEPLMRLRPIYWEGHEGEGIGTDSDQQPETTFAPQYIVETVLANPGEIHLIAIGPLTNIALALQQAPEIAEKLASLSIMGGVIRGNNDLDLPLAEHNILCDPHAAHVVFSSGAPITLTPLNITVQSKITQEHLKRIEQANTPFHTMLADQIRRYPRFATLGYTAPHDPLTIAGLLYNDIVETTPVDIQVETAGRISVGVTHAKKNPDGNVKLVTSVNVTAFENLLIEKLAN